MNTRIGQRVAKLRAALQQKGLNAYIFPSTDPHNGEYIPDYWKAREWISGFNGSAGTAVVTIQNAALWTDSRYFLAAEEQLQGTPFSLMKERLVQTPSIPQWLGKELPPESKVGIDATVNSLSQYKTWGTELAEYGIELVATTDILSDIWTDRPSIPLAPIELQPLEFAGETSADKLNRLRKELKKSHADILVISELDEIAWTLNLRGTDIHCNPVFVSYLILTTHSATLFTFKEKITEQVHNYLSENNIQTENYDKVFHFLSQLKSKNIQLDSGSANFALINAISNSCHIIDTESPVAMMKAVKNQTEVNGYRNAMRRDGVALVKFLKWLKPAVTNGHQTECSIDHTLTQFRAEGSYYKGISFDTIAGYAHHGAIVHYEATEESDIPLEPKGLLLLDSGAQYLDGTTDITRTIALGPVTDEEIHDYTLVLKGHIRLAMVKFPEGSSGTQLDICARYAMWQEGINYLHGTGHGVGSYLNVHEGPHQLRMNYMPAPLLPYMTVTNEPGIYKAGKHGVRIENTQLIVPFCQGEFGPFLQFEPLTLCPIDTTPIDWHMLNKEEIEWLNHYHQRVYDELSPLLDEEHKLWLKEATQPHEIKTYDN